MALYLIDKRTAPFFSAKVYYSGSGFEVYSFVLCVVHSTGHFALCIQCADLESHKSATNCY